MSEDHPDVMIYSSYDGGEERHHLRLVTMTTPKFPHGLALGYDFTGPTRKADAEAVAKEVQGYINDLKEHWLTPEGRS